MSLKRKLRAVYRANVLPVLRGFATPCFRLAVGAARRTGLLPRDQPAAPDQPHRFLIVHLSNHVGDTVMLLPMIEALRNAHPNASIECAVQAPIAPFLSLVPALNHVYEFHVDHGPTTTPWVELRRTLIILRTFRRTMARARPSTCIVPRWGCGFRDLMLAYLTHAPARIGFASNDFDRSQPPAGYRDALLTRRIQGAQRMTEPARFLFLLEQAGLVPTAAGDALGPRPNPSMLQIASTIDWPALAARLGLPLNAPIAVIAPGASAPRRMWPVDRWATVVEGLHAQGFTVALLTGNQDAHVARDLFQSMPSGRRDRTALVAGVTSLAESTCLIAYSRLFVGNDSGPGHIAGALRIPCVILFIAAVGADPDGPSAPERVRPMGQQVVCVRPARTVPPCTGFCTAECAHCILQIEAKKVLDAIRSVAPLLLPLSV